jgi:hypothetical protein
MDDAMLALIAAEERDAMEEAIELYTNNPTEENLAAAQAQYEVLEQVTEEQLVRNRDRAERAQYEMEQAKAAIWNLPYAKLAEQRAGTVDEDSEEEYFEAVEGFADERDVAGTDKVRTASVDSYAAYSGDESGADDTSSNGGECSGNEGQVEHQHGNAGQQKSKSRGKKSKSRGKPAKASKIGGTVQKSKPRRAPRVLA